ncbi:MAG TPA: dTMP kinase [Syntrophomonas sp.]|jgi:dTMP kinase|nr:dTMP kinase [Syntrophomonas sp.]
MGEGLLISLEGIDGSGKTTLIQYLQEVWQEYPLIKIREPGGTVISEKIRELLLNVENRHITPRTEALLYAAARSQVVDQLIRPSLEQGKIVLADRYLDSTIAYQGYGRGLDLQFLYTLNRLCTDGLLPDATILLDLEPGIGELRRNGEAADRLEKEGREFQARVRQGYLELARQEPERIHIIDAGRAFADVAADALNCLQQLLMSRGWKPVAY